MLINVHILSHTLVFHHRNPIATTAEAAATTTAASTTTVAAVTEIILSESSIGITIIEMKTNAAYKAAYEHLSATTTLVVIYANYLCVAT